MTVIASIVLLLTPMGVGDYGSADAAERALQPGVAVASVEAERINPPSTTTTTTEPVPSGIYGQPYAPPGLSACDNAEFYRVQWGLPIAFRNIVWRESNCRNEEGVHTFCCWSRYQLWVSLHLQDATLRPRYEACGVFSRFDVDSDTEPDKQRAACAARALYDTNGLSPW